jgi:hypothetical protein
MDTSFFIKLIKLARGRYQYDMTNACYAIRFVTIKPCFGRKTGREWERTTDLYLGIVALYTELRAHCLNGWEFYPSLNLDTSIFTKLIKLGRCQYWYGVKSACYGIGFV